MILGGISSLGSVKNVTYTKGSANQFELRYELIGTDFVAQSLREANPVAGKFNLSVTLKDPNTIEITERSEQLNFNALSIGKKVWDSQTKTTTHPSCQTVSQKQPQSARDSPISQPIFETPVESTAEYNLFVACTHPNSEEMAINLVTGLADAAARNPRFFVTKLQSLAGFCASVTGAPTRKLVSGATELMMKGERGETYYVSSAGNQGNGVMVVGFIRPAR